MNGLVQGQGFTVKLPAGFQLAQQDAMGRMFFVPVGYQQPDGSPAAVVQVTPVALSMAPMMLQELQSLGQGASPFPPLVIVGTGPVQEERSDAGYGAGRPFQAVHPMFGQSFTGALFVEQGAQNAVMILVLIWADMAPILAPGCLQLAESVELDEATSSVGVQPRPGAIPAEASRSGTPDESGKGHPFRGAVFNGPVTYIEQGATMRSEEGDHIEIGSVSGSQGFNIGGRGNTVTIGAAEREELQGLIQELREAIEAADLTASAKKFLLEKAVPQMEEAVAHEDPQPGMARGLERLNDQLEGAGTAAKQVEGIIGTVSKIAGVLGIAVKTAAPFLATLI